MQFAPQLFDAQSCIVGSIAKQLLKHSRLSSSEIGQVVGFCDQSHFTNAFQRPIKLTPRQYRNQQ
ncbi:helix-turn-helix domain-containing protein [Leptolyngbyaceae cyanobacterium UHCC 1019]